MVKGTQGRTSAEYPRRKLYAQPGTAEGNPQTRWRSAKVGNPHGSKSSDSIGNRTEDLGAAVFGQQLWISSEAKCAANDSEGKRICGGRIQICCVCRLIPIFQYTEPRTAYESITQTDTGYARTALD